MDSKNLKEWSADELLAEVKRRQRAVTGAAGKDRRASASPVTGRMRDLAAVPTSKLTKLVQDRQRVIYGVDNRKDLYQVTKPMVRKVAGAVAALVEANDLTENTDGSFTLRTESYQQSYQLCGSEPFVSQPLGCFCTGFLVAPDVIATAGHCVKSQADLNHIRFVFGFKMVNSSTPRTSFPAEDLYEGSKLIGRQLAHDGTDWALVRLDRPVTGRTPVKFRATGKIKDGQSLFVIGHPCGLPQKYAPGAQVRDNSPQRFFVANLDTYGGNSGSPVFNAQNGAVEGILVRGENDFVTNGTCYVSLVCPTTGCRGEDVTRATVWAAKVSKAGITKSGIMTRGTNKLKKSSLHSRRSSSRSRSHRR